MATHRTFTGKFGLREDYAMRRAIDLLFATVMLTLLFPILCMVALAISADSAGGPFYKALRCGKSGRVFHMWKFRTMIPNAATVGPVITGRNDPRITRLGQFLRSTKIDELPQLINVLLGDMTIVGPRPEDPAMVARYTPDQFRVLDVKPGVTGRQQLAGEESESIPEDAQPEEYYVQHILRRKLNADLDYLRTRTAWTDAEIVLSTVGYVLRAPKYRWLF
jgi:lipopolysaccharide/colanic/teichoic acid biosynthesis glycosyltransferase